MGLTISVTYNTGKVIRKEDKGKEDEEVHGIKEMENAEINIAEAVNHAMKIGTKLFIKKKQINTKPSVVFLEGDEFPRSYSQN